MLVRSDGGEVYFDVTMTDAWVWDIYRPARFAKKVRVVTFKDVNVEELAKADLGCPRTPSELSLGAPGRPGSSTGGRAECVVHRQRVRASRTIVRPVRVGA